MAQRRLRETLSQTRATMSQGDDSPAAQPEEEPAGPAVDAEQPVTEADNSAAAKAASICKQVEHYFSDANLPTDEYMLTRIRKNKQGWGAHGRPVPCCSLLPHTFALAVPLSCIVKFNKMKKLCKGDAAVVAQALREGSTAVEVNPSGTSCRRVAPLPAHDPFEIGTRTVLVENLPADATAASLTKQFSAAGSVVVARLCSPSSTHAPSTLHAAAAERDPWGTLNVTCAQQHALVEFQTREEAQKAVSLLNDATNWRTGLKVRLVRRDAPQAPKQKGAAAADEEEVDEEGGAVADDGGGRQETDGAQTLHKENKEDKRHSGKVKKDYASWASVAAHKQKQAQLQSDVAAADTSGAPPPEAERTAPRRFFAPKSTPGGGPSSEPAAPGSGFREARMPDGTRGFAGMGRGARALSYGTPRAPSAVIDESTVE